jgi:hypothetical protein
MEFRKLPYYCKLIAIILAGKKFDPDLVGGRNVFVGKPGFSRLGRRKIGQTLIAPRAKASDD